MLLYCNGCSFTKGTELSLEGNLKLAWPYLLANKLDATLINDSQAGQSNLMIYKKTVDQILSIEKKPDLAIIQWTFIERFDTPVSLERQKHPFFDTSKISYHTHYPFTLKDSNKNNHTFYKQYFNIQNTPHIEYLVDTSLFYIYMLQSFLKAKRIPFIFMDFDNNRRYGSINPKRKNKQYTPRLEMNNWIHDFKTSMPEILFSYDYKLKIGDDHFLKDAHEFISEAILDYYYLGDKLFTKRRHIQSRQRDIIHFYGDDM